MRTYIYIKTFAGTDYNGIRHYWVNVWRIKYNKPVKLGTEKSKRNTLDTIYEIIAINDYKHKPKHSTQKYHRKRKVAISHKQKKIQIIELDF